MSSPAKPSGMPEKDLERVDASRMGTGCITRDEDGREIFFRVRSSVDGGPTFLPGQRVTYDVEEGEDGRLYAVNIELADDD
ncbi:cold-shock protein [Pseudomonas sp. PSKL.D1]|uniref:cold-shock protein n=1 Tax=Pseudomonas sp. PSKL.D1 TaxID=3029060 RepID=UPI00238131AC|nr:hypothetical protein [Pseudomonas sp. PSKL.D1]WDY59332.1 hypothetical protein PVV54_06800 [Pseudomonas sp. PSKL.D1]